MCSSNIQGAMFILYLFSEYSNFHLFVSYTECSSNHAIGLWLGVCTTEKYAVSNTSVTKGFAICYKLL